MIFVLTHGKDVIGATKKCASVALIVQTVKKMIKTSFDVDEVLIHEDTSEEIGSMTQGSERTFIVDIIINGGVAHEEFKLTFSNEY